MYVISLPVTERRLNPAVNADLSPKWSVFHPRTHHATPRAIHELLSPRNIVHDSINSPHAHYTIRLTCLPTTTIPPTALHISQSTNSRILGAQDHQGLLPSSPPLHSRDRHTPPRTSDLGTTHPRHCALRCQSAFNRWTALGRASRPF